MPKNCKNCGVNFEVAAEDLAFYDKVSPVIAGVKYSVPEPTHCMVCRVQRRMGWRNDRVFYYRKCDLTGKSIVSIYPAETEFPVYHQSVWYSDKWDPMTYGLEYDFSKSFFEQWSELMSKVPRLGMDLVNCENSDFCNYCGDDKNCYLDIAGEANEDCYFCLFTKYSKNCVDCTFVYSSTLCYESIQCYNSYNVKYSESLDNCSDCSFCYDCKGSRNCFMCVNLRNAEYCIFNIQYSKEEYERKIAEFRLETYSGLQNALKIWRDFKLNNAKFNATYLNNSEDCIGDGITNSKNCKYSFNVTSSRDCKYLYDVLDATDCYDLNYSLYNPECSYELISTLQMKFSAFNMASHYCSNVFYCDLTNNSSNLFGCIGLNQKQYCILNKQYSKEEYEVMVPKIIRQMFDSGEWGEFFPLNISPFGYNETVSCEYLPMSQENIIAKGWKLSPESTMATYIGENCILPDSINETDETYKNKVLTCLQSGKHFKIIGEEFNFYKKNNIPLPRISPQERHKNRNLIRPARWLWNRNCTSCNSSVYSSYDPARPEKIYCEKCYLNSVYA